MRTISSELAGVVALCWVAMGGVIGCTTTSRDYPGVAADALWKAAVGAAQHPRYTDWMVTENGVFVDEPAGRIEVYRELKRDHAPPGAALQRQSEIWTLSIRVETHDRLPKVVIDTRSTLRSPGFWKQTDHFFTEIDSRLAQSTSAAAATSEQAPAAHPNANGLEAPSAQDKPVAQGTAQQPAASGAAQEPMKTP
ncbi:MAG: hypothetical protein EXS17_04030 [Phycisphaerales bacterium]|nr:hypothetical protein [Phycisphaerales bacterium]